MKNKVKVLPLIPVCIRPRAGGVVVGGNPTYLMFRNVTSKNVCFQVTLLSFPEAVRAGIT